MKNQFNFKFNIRMKIALGYVLIICCLGAAIVIVTDRVKMLQHEIETITTKDMEVHNLITSIRYDVVNMETSQRGFLITGDETYLQPYQEGKTQWEASYNSLYALISETPSTQKKLESIKLTIEHWLSTTGEPTIELRREGKTDQIMDFFANDPGKQDIDDLREQIETLRNEQVAQTSIYIAELKNRNDMLTISLYIMLFVVAILAFLIVAYVSNNIVRTISRVSAAIQEITAARGDLTKRIHVRTRDEIKDLAEATNKLLDSLEAQSWVQTRVANIATMNQGMNDLNDMATSFLSHTAPMVGALSGAIYLRRGQGAQQRMEILASYAGEGKASAKSSFLLGEGLIGQCAADKRSFLLNAPITDYDNQIQTGLSEFRPQSVLVFPVEFENKVIAVIEFASMEHFTSQHLKLLEQIEDHLGVAFDNVASRMEVERLLGESQTMTEELKAQTEELQAQSEELQMQQEEMRMTTEHLEEQNLYAEQKTKELELAKSELEEYADKLKQSAQYKTNFLANMSHELRTPLNSILILSQMLFENDNKSLMEEEVGYARVIHSSGNDLLKLIDDILDLSKIEAGKITLIKDEVNVTEIPDLMKLSFDPVAEKKQVAFHIEIEEGLPEIIHTDGQRLQQVLKNLLSNAFKFTEKGSVTLKIHLADPTMAEECLPGHPSNEWIAFSVIDTGIGIPKDKQELVFEAFQQVDGNTNRIYGGTGLGLSICNEFAQLLGGCLVLSSELHKGSTFTFYLPVNYEPAAGAELQLGASEAAASVERDGKQEEELAHADQQSFINQKDEAASKTAASSSESHIFHNKKVLLVEDDARNIFAIVNALEQKGLQVTVAGNGKECLDIVEDNTDFDLVLMDIMMPVMDGFEATRALRQHPVLKDIPIIALTAKAMKSDQESCLQAGASDYISKPIHMDQLFSLIRVWLTKQVDH
ncbi:CHASE3 domain-containing protein [Paenibacillus sp. HB172176]|uniref:CHASE3 domain-containing protein n=1 Tax=Paenibacillus sp. HB172176 TaxID=2493690 RepID=UPI00143C7D7B|nr:CHASE3 domain-containing protein [Paenibacillus sp. HB172176]